MPKVKVEKGKVKVKKEIKKEKGVVKKEIVDDKKKTGVRTASKGFDQLTHYRHQVGFLDEVVKPPWKLCFGALGTGIIGIQPETKSTSSSSKAKVKTEPGTRSTSSSSHARVKTEPADDDDEGPSRIPPDATVVLLLNAPTCQLQGRNGNAMGNYGDALDVENRCLHWKSQRCDTKNTKIGAIVAHSKNGGRVVVGVRSQCSVLQGSNAAKFKLLGVVSKIDNVQDAKFLVEEGVHLICDGIKLHKNITASCLDPGLKTGIGLTAKRYPLKEKEAQEYRFCRACCYSEANARLNFDKLNEDGVATYTGTGKRGRVGKDAEGESTRKRLRFKQEVPWLAVKQEREDSPQGSRTAGSASKPAAKAKMGSRSKLTQAAMAKAKEGAIRRREKPVQVKAEPKGTSQSPGRPVKVKAEPEADDAAKAASGKTSKAVSEGCFQDVTAVQEAAAKLAKVTKPAAAAVKSARAPKSRSSAAPAALESGTQTTSVVEGSAPASPAPCEEQKEDCRLLLAMSQHSPIKKAWPPVIDIEDEDSCLQAVDSAVAAAESKDCPLPFVQPGSQVVGIDVE